MLEVSHDVMDGQENTRLYLFRNLGFSSHVSESTRQGSLNLQRHLPKARVGERSLVNGKAGVEAGSTGEVARK